MQMKNQIAIAVSTLTAEHYSWGEVCDGWRLLATPGLSVIEERMPPGSSEQRHHHDRARQFFYNLAGTLTMEIEGREYRLQSGEGIEVHPAQKHQAFNREAVDARFLVISQPSTQGDRVIAL
jgi:mannose-6-phosphate isomerase-like protein (cupin superfamily)